MAKKYAPLEKTSSSLFDSIGAVGGSTSAFSGSGPDASSGETGDEVVSKRLSVWAVVATALGVLSLLSLLYDGFLFLAALALASAVAALVGIARSGGETVGRGFALAGLALGIAGAVCGPVRAAVYRADFNRQADAFCKLWFETAKSGDYLALRQMESTYWNRTAIVDERDAVKYWKQMVGDEERHYGAHSYLANPTLLTLATLGDKARATFYATERCLLSASDETASRVYAVTADVDGRKQTFFLRFVVERKAHKLPEGQRMVGWSVRLDGWRPIEIAENGLPKLNPND